MESHKVLIIGSGGRENALAWKIAQSKFCEKLFIAQECRDIFFGKTLKYQYRFWFN